MYTVHISPTVCLDRSGMMSPSEGVTNNTSSMCDKFERARACVCMREKENEKENETEIDK